MRISVCFALQVEHVYVNELTVGIFFETCRQ